MTPAHSRFVFFTIAAYGCMSGVGGELIGFMAPNYAFLWMAFCLLFPIPLGLFLARINDQS